MVLAELGCSSFLTPSFMGGGQGQVSRPLAAALELKEILEVPPCPSGTLGNCLGQHGGQAAPIPSVFSQIQLVTLNHY